MGYAVDSNALAIGSRSYTCDSHFGKVIVEAESTVAAVADGLGIVFGAVGIDVYQRWFGSGCCATVLAVPDAAILIVLHIGTRIVDDTRGAVGFARSNIP